VLELALDAPVAPGRVLLCETDDELTNLHSRGRTALSARVGPAPRDERAVPAQDGLRADQYRGPAPFRQEAAGGGKQRPVVQLEIRLLHLAVEDVELMAQHHDLDLLCFLGAQGEDGKLKKAPQNPIAKRHDDEMARFRFHGRRRLRHLPDSVTVAAWKDLITRAD
jgi:hypothetical protein